MPLYLCRNEQNTLREKLLIAASLLRYGIFVNLYNGRLTYISYVPRCKCQKLKLLRHGKTVAVERHEFMSDSSFNSTLTNEGIMEIKAIAKEVASDFPDVVLLAPLPRTMNTFRVLQKQIQDVLPVKMCFYMRGINNSIWEEKTFEMLDDDNLYVFLERECSHNIFAKSQNGDSWGDVLRRCTKLIREINTKFENKNVLLVSQGSIYQGIKILLHQSKTPWEGYSAEAMFCTIPSDQKKVGYGKLFNIC